MTLRSALLVACLVLGFVPGVYAQASKGKDLPERPPRPPSHEDVHYGPHERNVLDLYIAPSERPTPLVVWIHNADYRIMPSGVRKIDA